MASFKLSLSELAQALDYVANHPHIRFHTRGPRRGLMDLPSSVSPIQRFHLLLVQTMRPRLIVRHLPCFITLSVIGQELLDFLNDETYLAKLKADYIAAIGNTEPTDAQLFHEVWLFVTRHRLSTTSNHDMMQTYATGESTGLTGDSVSNYAGLASLAASQLPQLRPHVAPLVNRLIPRSYTHKHFPHLLRRHQHHHHHDDCEPGHHHHGHRHRHDDDCDCGCHGGF